MLPLQEQPKRKLRGMSAKEILSSNYFLLPLIFNAVFGLAVFCYLQYRQPPAINPVHMLEKIHSTSDPWFIVFCRDWLISSADSICDARSLGTRKSDSNLHFFLEECNGETRRFVEDFLEMSHATCLLFPSFHFTFCFQ